MSPNMQDLLKTPLILWRKFAERNLREIREAKLTCFHEAAHAVAAVLLLNGIKKVSVEGYEPRWHKLVGHPTWTHAMFGAKGFVDSADGYKLTRETICNAFVCMWVGALAHAAVRDALIKNDVACGRTWREPPDPPEMFGDLYEMKRVAAKIGLSDDEFGRFLQDSYDKSNAFIRDHFGEISRVSKKLFIKKVMTNEQVLAEIAEVEVHR